MSTAEDTIVHWQKSCSSIFDILMQEKTNDDSLPDSQFAAWGFKMYGKNIKSDTSGLMMYVRSDFPQKRRTEMNMITYSSRQGGS